MLGSIFLAGVVYLLMPPEAGEAARRMAFVFVLAAILWAFEIIPLYVTSVLVVVLQTFLLAQPGGVLGMTEGGYKVFFMSFGDPVIFLFLGGFVLAAVLQKYEIDKMIAVRLLNVFGHKPYFIMLGFMLVTAFFALWMSGTATTAMMLAMVMPFLKQIHEQDPFRTALILAIPFSASIGGIGTPIGTPPNAIAIGVLAEHGVYVDFITWVKMALPLAVVLVVIASWVLYWMFPAKAKHLTFAVKLERVFDHHARAAGVIALFTIIMWLTSSLHKIPAALVALFSICAFLLRRLLHKEDLKKIDWDILILMWGGLALGDGLEMSGLAQWLVGLPLFEQQGFMLVVVFCILTAVLTTFMSNTATANLVLPLVMVIPGESKILLATTVALSCSLSTALPISTPPNAIVFATQMIRSQDMLKAGLVISVISIALMLLALKWIAQSFGLV